VVRRRIGKVLSVTLALPQPTEEEILYKKGAPFSLYVLRPEALEGNLSYTKTFFNVERTAQR
jgi:hypothetical protein